MPFQAFEMASWSATDYLTGLVHRADHGSQYLPLRYSDRLADLGIRASTRSVGDSYDIAMTYTINRLFKIELIKPRKSWRTVEEVEIATLEWVWWFNNTRLRSELSYLIPNEIENDYYDSQHASRPLGALANR